MKLNKNDDGDIQWFDSIEDVKPEYYPIKVTSLLQFYTLKRKIATLLKENIEPIRYLQYVVYTSAENKYYMRLFRAYDLDTLYFYKKTLTFSGEDEAVSNLRRYVEDGNVWLLLSVPQIAETTALLTRLWKANLQGEGKLDYKIYLKLLEGILDLEEYKDYGKSLVGYKTVCNQMQLNIDDLWRKASEVNVK